MAKPPVCCRINPYKTGSALPLTNLILMAAIALGAGCVTALLLRVGGLVLLMLALACIIGLRWLAGYAHPDGLAAIILLVALQAGYLIVALSPLSGRLHGRNPAPHLAAKAEKDTD